MPKYDWMTPDELRAGHFFWDDDARLDVGASPLDNFTARQLVAQLCMRLDRLNELLERVQHDAANSEENR